MPWARMPCGDCYDSMGFRGLHLPPAFPRSFFLLFSRVRIGHLHGISVFEAFLKQSLFCLYLRSCCCLGDIAGSGGG
jgi:hypothetical protein